MTIARQSAVVTVLVALALAARAAAQGSNDEVSIREARARSNAAIAAHDLPAIAREWMTDLHVVSSTSAQAAGRDANQP